jgi:hypothetical protein
LKRWTSYVEDAKFWKNKMKTLTKPFKGYTKPQIKTSTKL